MARAKRTLGKRLVRVLGALLGVAALAVGTLLITARTHWARARVARSAEGALARAGVPATCDDARLELPPGIVLSNVRVPSTDGGRPLLEAKSAHIRFRTASLFLGRLEASTVDVDAPTVRALVKDGKVAGLAMPKTRAPGAPWPFGALNVRSGRVETAGAGVRLIVDGLEVTARAKGNAGEVALRASRGAVEQGEHGAEICGVDAQVSVRPGAVLVSHLGARVAGHPECSAADTASLTLEGGTVDIESEGAAWQAQGPVHAQGAMALLGRFVSLPRLEGTFDLHVHARIGGGSRLPELRGQLDAFDLVIGPVQVARSLHARVDTAGDQVGFPEATLDTIEGEARVSDVTIRPFAPGAPVRARVDAEHLRFGDFLRALGVSDHPHVAWDLDSVRWRDVSGTLAPFVLSGDLSLETGAFSIHDAACDLERCRRVWGVRRATIAGRASLDAHGFSVRNVHATIPGGRATVDRVLIGFRDALRVEGGHVRVALQEVSPLASLALDGNLRADVSVDGRLNDPEVHIEGTIQRLDLDHHLLGDIHSFRARYRRAVVGFEDVRARSGSSDYRVESARIALPARGRVDVDATVSAKAVALRDLRFALLRSEASWWDSLDGSLQRARARLRYVRGGESDPRGRGTLLISATASLDHPSVQVDVESLAFEGTECRGQMAVRNLDVAALLRALKGARHGKTAPEARDLGAWVSGDLRFSALDLRDPSHARATFALTAAQASFKGQSLRLRPGSLPLVLADDEIVVPGLAFDVGPAGRPAGIATVHGSIASVSREPEIDAALDATNTGTQVLVGPVPWLKRADGTFHLALTARGHLGSPMLGGRLQVRATSAKVGFIPDELRDVEIDAALGARELTVARARARIGRGTVDLSGSAPLAGDVAPVGDFGLMVKGVHLPIGNNVVAKVDASTHLLVRTPLLLAGRPHAAYLTGQIELRKATFEFLRAIPLDLTALEPLAPWLVHPGGAPHETGIVDLDLSVHVRQGVPRDPIGLALLGATLPLPRRFWLRGTNARPQVVSTRETRPDGLPFTLEERGDPDAAHPLQIVSDETAAPGRALRVRKPEKAVGRALTCESL